MERVIVWHRWLPPSESSREASALATSWRASVRDRFAKIEAELLLELGGSVVLALEPTQLARAVEICIHAVREIERERDDAAAGAVACGIAIGAIERVDATSPYTGDAIDRALALAHVAGPHEVLLDPAAQAATSGLFLCAREVTFGLGLEGAVLDRAFPRRSDCQRSLVQLRRPPFVANGQAQFESLRRLAKSNGRHRVLLVGPHGLGIGQWIARIADELAPPVWLDVRPLGACIAPLSGLTYALRRVPSAASPERLLSRNEEPDPQARDTLIAIREGRAVNRRDAVVALRHYLARASESGRRALISVDPAPLIDPATIGVIAEAAREGGPEILVMLRLLLDSKPPETFARGGGLSEIRVRGLSQHEARALASGMLGVELPNDIARRAAAMGGANPLAVVEAVRVLVASGDVVFENEAFRWRRGPAGRLSTLTLQALLEERVEALGGPFRRALEVLTSVPDPDDRALASEVAASDGLLPETWERAVEELEVLGLVQIDARGVCVSSVVRAVTQASLSPARSLELHRAVLTALSARMSSEQRFSRATLAHYLARAGRNSEAAELFLEVAQLSGQLGFVRSGVRLAARAVECDPGEATRARAAQLAERLIDRQSAHAKQVASAVDAGHAQQAPRAGDSVAQSLGGEARQRAVHAILARDFDEVERAMELLVASGRAGASVDRLRTVTLLVKGDHAGAIALLDRLRQSQPPRRAPQVTLTSALVSIATGDLEPAVRDCLEALARTREAHDVLGESAALSVLSMCYRKLGREADAHRLARAALDTSAAAQ
jgi:tetratricopeptide (TPR) repeat protein